MALDNQLFSWPSTLHSTSFLNKLCWYLVILFWLQQPLSTEVWDWSQASPCGIYGGQSDNGPGFSQVLCFCHQHHATKPSCSYSIHLPMMSHDPSILLKTHSHFQVRCLADRWYTRSRKLFFWFWKIWVNWPAAMDPTVPMHLSMTQMFKFVRHRTLLWWSPAVKSVCMLTECTCHTLHYHCHTHYNTVNTTVNVCIPLVVKVCTSLTSSTFKFPGVYFTGTTDSNGSRHSSVTLLTREWVGWLRNCGSNPSKGKIYLYPKASRVALGPAQPTMHWVAGAIPCG